MRRLAAVLAAGLVATGASAQTQPRISDDVVKIGLVLDMSSLYADITGTGSVTAAKMAVEDFGGKVLGKPIEVLSADHQNKPDIAANTAREWFDRQGGDGTPAASAPPPPPPAAPAPNDT